MRFLRFVPFCVSRFFSLCQGVGEVLLYVYNFRQRLIETLNPGQPIGSAVVPAILRRVSPLAHIVAEPFDPIRPHLKGPGAGRVGPRRGHVQDDSVVVVLVINVEQELELPERLRA